MADPCEGGHRQLCLFLVLSLYTLQRRIVCIPKRWGTVGDGPSLRCVGQVPEKTDGTTECRPSSSLILTCRATLENDGTGRQTAVRPRPGSGRTDCPVANTESTLSRKRRIGLATHDKQKKRRSRRNTIRPDDTRHIPDNVTLEASEGSQCGGDPTTPKGVADTCVPRPSDAAFVGNSVSQTGPWKPELMPYNSKATHSKGFKASGKKKIRNPRQTCLQSSTPNTKPNIVKSLANETWMPNPRLPASDSPRPDSHGGNNLPPTRIQIGAMEHTPQKTQKLPHPPPVKLHQELP